MVLIKQTIEEARCYELKVIEIPDEPTFALQSSEQPNGDLAETRNAPDLKVGLSRPEIVGSFEVNRPLWREDSCHLGNHQRDVLDVLDHGMTDDQIEC